MLLVAGKGIRGGVCHKTHWYGKTNHKYMKDYDKKKKLSYLNYLGIDNLYGCL